jgi:hypothetical protein
MTITEIIILAIIFGIALCISIYAINYGIKIIVKNDQSLSMNEKIMVNMIGYLGGEKLRKNREDYFKNPEYRRKNAYLNIISGSTLLVVVIYIIINLIIKFR